MSFKHILMAALSAATWCGAHAVYAQQMPPTYHPNGVSDQRPRRFAITGGDVVVKPGVVRANTTVVIANGRIESVGGAIPAGAVVVDATGKKIYPSFIELSSDAGLGEQAPNSKVDRRNPQLKSNTPGPYAWNEALRPETNAAALFATDAKAAEAMRAAGIGAAVVHRRDGIARGTGAFVSTSDDAAQVALVRPNVTRHFSFNKGSSTQDYPGSLMGSIALLRQTFHDARWYARGGSAAERNLSYEAWISTAALPAIFEAGSALNALRADKVGDEFGVQFVLQGGGDEYRYLRSIKNTNATFILPLTFPKAIDVSDPLDAMNASIDDMRHVILARSNAAVLEKEGITFAFTSSGLQSPAELLPRVREAVKYGLSPEGALKALTTVPAAIAGVDAEAGSIEAGKIASLIIADGDLFAEQTQIVEHFVAGNRYVLASPYAAQLRGVWNADAMGKAWTITASTTPGGPSLSFRRDSVTIAAANVKLVDAALSFSLTVGDSSNAVTYDFSASLGQGPGGKKSLSGLYSSTGGGDWTGWSAVWAGPDTAAQKNNAKGPVLLSSPAMMPTAPYGWESLPTAETVLIKNATVWTCEAAGKIEGADVLISNGKIQKVGKDLSAAGARILDAAGKHLTPGIIDEHSHIAVDGGVNEWTEAVTAEVRIGDVVDPTDINIYRQLAGGVTTSQLLHGSANPIGGQSAVIKLRWGRSADEMLCEYSPGHIKFALGENVKQSNWGDFNTIRFPQTRMGVEQVFMDAFTRAVEYKKKMAGPGATAVRHDLELEALAEIIDGKRFITCHSYVQSEIIMLMKVAEHFGFRVNTFTHILEGYKVADIMRQHGAGASTFSDWWAYKYEVRDAIPFNGAMLWQQGVVTAFNSDDAEMGRRLNQEAGKAVKYGGVPEEEALKFVTINPAKLLHIDSRTGSIKEGKDADLVIWNDHPLSVYARPEYTFVDGIPYFDAKRDEAIRAEMPARRAELVQAMRTLAAGGTETTKPVAGKPKHYHCDTIGSGCAGEEGEDHK